MAAVCECDINLVGDGNCQNECFTENCGFDSGDCCFAVDRPIDCTPATLNNDVCNDICDNDECMTDNGNCIGSTTTCGQTGCPVFLLNNDQCDDICNNRACNFDNENCFEQNCRETCPEGFEVNEFCDPECDNQFCRDDNGACENPTCPCSTAQILDDICNPECNIEACNFDSDSCCGNGCSIKTEVGDGQCQQKCNVQECDFDGGDCAESLITIGSTAYLLLGGAVGFMVLCLAIILLLRRRGNRKMKKGDTRRGYGDLGEATPLAAEIFTPPDEPLNNSIPEATVAAGSRISTPRPPAGDPPRSSIRHTPQPPSGLPPSKEIEEPIF